MVFEPSFSHIRLFKAKKYPGWATGIPRTNAGKDAYIIAAKYETRFSNAFIDAMGDLFTPEIRRNFLVAWRQRSIKKMVASFPFLDESEVEDNSAWEKLLERFRQAYSLIIRAAAEDEATETNKKIGTRIKLGVLKIDKIPMVPINPYANEWIKKESLNLITQGLIPHQETIVRSLLADRMKRGVRAETAYKDIQDNIGLTDREYTSAENRMQLHLDAGLPVERSIELTAKYRKQLFRKRSIRIARTETISAQSEGRRALWQGAVDDGHINPTTVERFWITAPGGCPICNAIDGDPATIGGGYQTEDGFVTGPPAHPQCRCSESIRRKVN